MHKLKAVSNEFRENVIVLEDLFH